MVQQNNLVMIDVGSLEYDVIERNLSVPTLAESVLQDCVYVIKNNGINGTGESCSYYMINKFEGKIFFIDILTLRFILFFQKNYIN